MSKRIDPRDNSLEECNQGVNIHIRGINKMPQSTKLAIAEMCKLAVKDIKSGKFDNDYFKTIRKA